MTQASPESIYCCQCGYQLTGLSENRCPECGRRFEPADVRTYMRYPKGWLLRRWLRRAVLALLSVLALASAGIGWLYWGWRAEQPAVAMVRQYRRNAEPSVSFNVISAPLYRIDARLGGHLGFLFERVARVYLNGTPVRDDDLRLLRPLSHLRGLCIGKSAITDQGLEHLAGLTQLVELDLGQTRITDAGLVHLRKLRNLRELHLCFNRLTGEGFVNLEGMTRLEELQVQGTQITDASLVHVKDLKQLENLGIGWSGITDGALVHLKDLNRLWSLHLNSTAVTGTGFVHLMNLPLKNFDVVEAPIDDAALDRVKGMKSVRTLHLKGCSRITPEALAGFKRVRPDACVDDP